MNIEEQKTAISKLSDKLQDELIHEVCQNYMNNL